VDIIIILSNVIAEKLLTLR